MENFVVQAVYQELKERLVGQHLGKVFQLNSTDCVFDFHLTDGSWLFVSCRPNDPQIYLTDRSIKSLDTEGKFSPQFALVLRKHLSGASLLSLRKPPIDRLIEFEFSNYDSAGETRQLFMIVELMGRSSNILLLNGDRRIIDKLKYKRDESLGLVVGTEYALPPLVKAVYEMSDGEIESLFDSGEVIPSVITKGLPGFGPLLAEELICRTQSQPLIESVRAISNEVWHLLPQPTVYGAGQSSTLSSIKLKCKYDLPAMTFRSISKAAQYHYDNRREASDLAAQVANVRARIRARLDRNAKLTKNLKSDLAGLGNETLYKRYGDLLLANLATMQRDGDIARVTDLYDPEQRVVEIPLDANITPQTGAERFFKQYQKARRGRLEIEKRLKVTEREMDKLHNLLSRLETVSSAEDLLPIQEVLEPAAKSLKRRSEQNTKSQSRSVAGVRSFQSSDGYEIWVGRTSKDNDNLTFKLARPSDIWMHAADYAGSHVVVRNPNRKQIPHKTIVEAAQLAAYFSKAKTEGKAVVRYTERKFVHKPKGAAPGLVRIASFKSVTVVPAIPAGSEVV
jgi:predicted ribosome quality control (RQC) complex YloA/Tae2 family protein